MNCAPDVLEDQLSALCRTSDPVQRQELVAKHPELLDGKLVQRLAESVRQQRADQKASDESARQLLAHAGSRALHGHAEPLGNS